MLLVSPVLSFPFIGFGDAPSGSPPCQENHSKHMHQKPDPLKNPYEGNTLCAKQQLHSIQEEVMPPCGLESSNNVAPMTDQVCAILLD